MNALGELIKDLDACWEAATPEYRAASAQRYNQLRANLVKQLQDLKSIDAQLHSLAIRIGDAIKAMEALQVGPGGNRRLGISFFDPLVFIRLSQLGVVVESLGSAATTPNSGPMVEVVKPASAAAQAAQTVKLTYSIGSGPRQEMTVTVDRPANAATAGENDKPVTIDPQALDRPPVISAPGANAPIVADPSLLQGTRPAATIPPKVIVLPIDPKLLQEGGFVIDPAILGSLGSGQLDGPAAAAVSSATADDLSNHRRALDDVRQAAQQAAGQCDRPAFQQVLANGAALQQGAADQAKSWIPNAVAMRGLVADGASVGGPAGAALAAVAGADGVPNLVAAARNHCPTLRNLSRSTSAGTAGPAGTARGLIGGYTEASATAQAWAGLSVMTDAVMRNIVRDAPPCVKPAEDRVEWNPPPGGTTIFVPFDGDPQSSVPDAPGLGDVAVSTAACRTPVVTAFGGPGRAPSALMPKPFAVTHSCLLDTPAVVQRAQTLLEKRFSFDPRSASTQPVPGLEIDGQQVCVTDIPIFTPVGAPEAGTCVGDTDLPAIEGDGFFGWDEFRTVQQPKPATGDPLFRSRGSWAQSFDDQWALKRIGYGDDWPPLAAAGRRGRVVVAVIDSGIDLSHPDLAGMVWHNPRELPFGNRDNDRNGYVGDYRGWNFVNRNGDVRDLHGHGTFVAGVIAARPHNGIGIAGVNPWARIMPLKVVDVDGSTRSSRIAEAVAYAVKHGARVINVSLGGKGVTRLEQAAFDLARKRGVLVVTAAGNLGVDTAQFGPAGAFGALTVASTDTADARAGFSNWGAAVSVAAPGVDVLSLRARRTDMLLVEQKNYSPGTAFVGDDKRYYRASGTSFSAPLAAGLASLLIARDPALTDRQVMSIIRSTARDVGTPGVDQFTGYGLIDARAALKAPRDYLLLAGISGVEVVKKGNAQAVRVRGIADANAFKAARLEIGAGETPTAWKPVGAVKKSGEANSVLGDIPANELASSKVWQIRVIVTHGSGATREARFKLNLG
ncbi:MAG: S8 family serine peptidase [Xanthobacteraceae bacterium]|nr:S8 family serine peptidase [Xanthobacteraceae bacterium]